MSFVVQAVVSIHQLHCNKIIHRDIKTQNFFISTGHLLKIGDFGLATQDESRGQIHRTLQGTRFSSYFYPTFNSVLPFLSHLVIILVPK